MWNVGARAAALPRQVAHNIPVQEVCSAQIRYTLYDLIQILTPSNFVLATNQCVQDDLQCALLTRLG